MPIDNSTRFPKPLAADLRELSEGMAIVIDGDTAPKAIASGQYLFIKNHSTLATGGYHATAAIASGANVTSSNVTADADGIVNGAFSSLSEQIETLNSRINAHTVGASIDISGYNSTTNKYTCPSDGYIRVRSGNTQGNVTAIDVDGVDVWACCIATNKNAYNTLFVRAGMQAYVYVDEGTGSFARFSPLT